MLNIIFQNSLSPRNVENLPLFCSIFSEIFRVQHSEIGNNTVLQNKSDRT